MSSSSVPGVGRHDGGRKVVAGVGIRQSVGRVSGSGAWIFCRRSRVELLKFENEETDRCSEESAFGSISQIILPTLSAPLPLIKLPDRVDDNLRRVMGTAFENWDGDWDRAEKLFGDREAN